jgi:hypothetical protein
LFSAASGYILEGKYGLNLNPNSITGIIKMKGKTLEQIPLSTGRSTDKNKRENSVRKIRVLGVDWSFEVWWGGECSYKKINLIYCI